MTTALEYFKKQREVSKLDKEETIQLLSMIRTKEEYLEVRNFWRENGGGTGNFKGFISIILCRTKEEELGIIV